MHNFTEMETLALFLKDGDIRESSGFCKVI